MGTRQSQLYERLERLVHKIYRTSCNGFVFGQYCYCIEPGTGQRTGDTLTEKDENFFNNISPNGTISGDDIRLLIGRILQYGYRGGISTSWKSQNESDANCIAHAYATQILIWETIVGERDASFNHVSTGGTMPCLNV